MFNYIFGFVAIITLPLAKGAVQACIDTFQAGRNVRAFYEGFRKEWNRTEERPVPTMADIDLDLPSYEELFAVTDYGTDIYTEAARAMFDGEPTSEQRKAAKLALFQAYYKPAQIHDEVVISVPAVSDAQTACTRNNYRTMTSRQLRATLERWRDVNGYKPPKSISRMTKAEMLEEVLTEYELDRLNEV